MSSGGIHALLPPYIRRGFLHVKWGYPCIVATLYIDMQEVSCISSGLFSSRAATMHVECGNVATLYTKRPPFKKHPARDLLHMREVHSFIATYT